MMWLLLAVWLIGAVIIGLMMVAALPQMPRSRPLSMDVAAVVVAVLWPLVLLLDAVVAVIEWVRQE